MGDTFKNINFMNYENPIDKEMFQNILKNTFSRQGRSIKFYRITFRDFIRNLLTLEERNGNIYKFWTSKDMRLVTNFITISHFLQQIYLL